MKSIDWDDTGYHNYYSVSPNENTNGKRVAKLCEILYFYFLTSMLIIPRVQLLTSLTYGDNSIRFPLHCNALLRNISVRFMT